ncbi:MAG TPA: aminotransferase class I/II-fold pyridoxal phosphate-dependent enzyme [Thermoplasmata archaeon]|nr:aminotransferase class I/II-fold pyridoxal phosphate-dependent enzyme [Thermoplasmata archaeon]
MTEPPDEAPKGGKFRPVPEWVGPTTRLVHGARRPDWNAGAVVPPIYQTSTFRFPAERSEARERGRVYLYTRNENPTLDVPAETLRQLEGGESARLFASGMGAISSAVLGLVASGDSVVALRGIYGGTTDLLRQFLPRFGVAVHEIGGTEAREPEAHIARGTRLVVLETPTNPLLQVHDLTRWAGAAHAAGAILLVDNTFATPINQRPIALGADLVVHSATKYLGGHSDLVGGALVGRRELLDRIDPKSSLGAPLDPFAGFLLDRSLKTLALRVARHNENGRRVAAALRDHPAVARVHYPGLGSPQEEAIARRQMTGRGGVVAVSLRGGAPAVERFLDRLRLVEIAASLGGVESLVSVPGLTSHRGLSADERAALGIDDGLVRLALGIEEPEDLLRDLQEALDPLA